MPAGIIFFVLASPRPQMVVDGLRGGLFGKRTAELVYFEQTPVKERLLSFVLPPDQVVALAFATYEKKDLLKKWWNRLLRLKAGNTTIAVFGLGGAGKTTLGQLLTEGEARSLPRGTVYTESLQVEKYPLPDIGGLLIVPPGQERRIQDYWTELYRDLATGKSVGVVHVVSYGHNAVTLRNISELGEYEAGLPDSEVVARYLARERERELKILRELVPRLVDAKRNIWMMTLVAKQDLWWNDRLAVGTHYTQGEYETILGEVRRRRGETNFRHEYVSASLVMSNLSLSEGKVLVPTTSGYDDNLRTAHTAHLLNVMQTMAERKT